MTEEDVIIALEEKLQKGAAIMQELATLIGQHIKPDHTIEHKDRVKFRRLRQEARSWCHTLIHVSPSPSPCPTEELDYEKCES